MSEADTLLIQALRNRITSLENEVYVPGVWTCPLCMFTLLQSTLHAETGEVTARDKPGEHCPNCKSLMWRKTWKAYAKDMQDAGETQVTRAVKAEDKRDEYHLKANALADWAGDVCGLVSDLLEGGDYHSPFLHQMITTYSKGGVQALVTIAQAEKAKARAIPIPANEPGSPGESP